MLHHGDVLMLQNGEILCFVFNKYCFKVAFHDKLKVAENYCSVGATLCSTNSTDARKKNERKITANVNHGKESGFQEQTSLSNCRFNDDDRKDPGKGSPNWEIKTKSEDRNKCNEIKDEKITSFFNPSNSSSKRGKDMPSSQSCKRRKTDDSDDEKEVEKKLRQMREILKPTLSSSVNADSSPANRSQEQKNGWTEKDGKLFVYTSPGVFASSKIAAFDIDGTIITTKSGRVFPTDVHDWRILYTEIPGKLKQLSRNGFKVVFFTNQKGIAKGKVKIADFKKKVESIISKLQVPVQALVSTGSGIYRKPVLGMWHFLSDNANEVVPVDKSSSFYVGDAAGREVNWAPKRKKDFSCSDRLFALNAGIKFYTPEEYFLDKRMCAQYVMPSFNPGVLSLSTSALEPCTAVIVSQVQEVVICVGLPASGKSYFAKQHFIPAGYVHVNRDLLGSWQKCVAHCEAALSKGRSVVIDNTNPDKESRSRYITCARRATVVCRCFLFTVSLDHARHNNEFRQLTETEKSHVPVNEIVFNSYKSKYQQPEISEGFSEIVKVNFVPVFKNKKEETLYRQYILSK